MVRRPTERDRKPKAAKADVEDFEQPSVLDREKPCQEPDRSVRDREARLQAGEAPRRVRETDGGAAQLVRLGSILGVVDGHEIALGEEEADVERARLGPRQARRQVDDPELRRQPLRHERRVRRRIIGLDEEEHLALGVGIVERRERGHETGHHFGFVAQRDEHGIGR